MKTKNIYQGIALLAMALTTAACQNELNDAATQPQPGEKVNMTIRATQGMAPQTRTEYEDKLGIGTAGSVVVKWEGGKETNAPVEKIKVFGYAITPTAFTSSDELSSLPKTLSIDGLSITFEGKATQADKYLAIYPAENCEFDLVNDAESIYFSFLNQTQSCKTGEEMAHLKGYDIMMGANTTGTNNFDFEHKTTMLRFDLKTLPQTESATKITLTSSTNKIMAEAYISISNTNFNLMPVDYVKEISLNITNHTPSATSLKAYMMMPPIDLSNATLTITVNTNGGSIYTGTIIASASQQLEAGKCYTLQPTLTSPTVTVPNVKEGELKDKLDAITPDPKQDKLVLQGAVNATDVKALVTFLNTNTNFTTLDLSGITIGGSNTVTGFEGATSVTTVVLPNDAEVIGDDAFKSCTALTTVSQNEAEPTRSATTRASMPKKVKIVGASAFADCTSMTEMFLHSGINTIGDNAFAGCTAMTALVFEGGNTVGTGLTLGTNILAGCTQANLNILLPAITDVTKAATYKKALGKPTYYEYNGIYSTAKPGEKVISGSYKFSVPDGSGLNDFEFGGSFGK